MNSLVDHAEELKQALLQFVLESEGHLAVALETYSAQELARGAKSPYSISSDFVLDSFLLAGRVDQATPLDYFLATQPNLSEGDRQLVENWQRGFMGLFTVTDMLPDGFRLMNWLTAKHYEVKIGSFQPQRYSRLKPGEIIRAYIAPLDATAWMFFSPLTLLGKLGNPKLAIAIGHFKQHDRNNLYGDAPELLEEAWRSVTQQYQEFIQFFGSDEVTLPGYQLSEKLAEFQEALAQQRLKEAGLDDNQSVEQLAQTAGLSDAEVAEIKPASLTSTNRSNTVRQMVTPKTELPAHLRQADEVTILTHPRWGQIFLPHYERFKQLLAMPDPKTLPETMKIARQYWNDPAIPSYVWRLLANYSPSRLEAVLQSLSGDSAFTITDLDNLLNNADKPKEPELPDIASVPIHVHELFQTAMIEVNKDKGSHKDAKRKPVANKGFQLR